MAKLSDRELIDAILESPCRREAVEQLVMMMAATAQNGRLNGRYEVTIAGRQVSSAVYQHHCSRTLPERVSA
jgi:hypothetical protein